MDVFVNAVIFIVAGVLLWFFAGSLIGAVDRLSRHLHRSGFSVAFLVLGFLTSISEFSVAFNSIASGAPGVSVGNLIGATFVILFLIIPVFALASAGIRLTHAITRKNLFLVLLASLLPALLVMDGNATVPEGILALLAYGALFYSIHRQRTTLVTATVEAPKPLARDIGTILIGAAGIFFATHFLVEESVYFAGILTAPPSLIGLIVLSIGTNLPELVIALRSIAGKRPDIAFGDYLGSVAMNVPIFGLVALFSGTFYLETSEFFSTTVLLVIGVPLLYVFARTKNFISRREGALLLLFYLCFVVIQLLHLVKFATN